MNGQMLVATRKGLLQLTRKNGGWSVERTSFAGIPVTAVLHDARDGTLYAMLKHGHFGAKLSCIAPTRRAAPGPNSRRRLSRPMPPARRRCFRF
jgi:hypothetical protein